MDCEAWIELKQRAGDNDSLIVWVDFKVDKGVDIERRQAASHVNNPEIHWATVFIPEA